MKTTRQIVYQAIDGERDFQDSLRVKGRFTENVLPVPGELICIQEYVNKALKVYVSEPGEIPEETLHALRKIAAMCVRTMEHYGAPKRKK